jgi:hypothetical protein
MVRYNYKSCQEQTRGFRQQMPEINTKDLVTRNDFQPRTIDSDRRKTNILQIRKRKFRWLRKLDEEISKKALKWNHEGRRKQIRPPLSGFLPSYLYNP